MRQFRRSGWRGVALSFLHALRGVMCLLARQRHARFHALAGSAAIILGFLLHVSRVEWLALLICIGLVFAAEALNSAVEELADALHPDEHPGIGRAKDVAAAAVLFVAIVAAAIGALIFLPKLLP